jgi:hypothetical protein
MTSRQASTRALAVLAVVAAAGTLWSCGGSHESLTAPVAVQSVAPEDGYVTASGAAKVTVCHQGKDLKIAAPAVAAHLRHGDRVGSCKAVSVCPCFTQEGIAAVGGSYTSVAGTCSMTDPYLLTLQFVSGGAGTSVGTFEARVGSGMCFVSTLDPATGDVVASTLPVTSAQYTACKQAITGNSYYPAGCPR